MIKVDLTSAYHFIDIYLAHTTYLGFAWPNESAEMCYYKFLVLLFDFLYFIACYIILSFVGHLFRSGDLRVNLLKSFLKMVLVVPSLNKFLFKIVLK